MSPQTSGVARWFSQAPRALRLALPAALGAVGALGQAPYEYPLALLFALAAGFAMWRAQGARIDAALTGWAFGVGYFALALIWIVEPFQVDVARHGWMAPFALLLLSMGLALFWGLAFWVARLVSPAALGLVLCWTGTEMLRAYLFTGFPWASPAQVMIEGPVSRLLAWGGPHGATLALMLLAWLLSIPAGAASKASLRLGQIALFAGVALAFHLPQARPPSELTGQWVRLVQPNAAQHLKWQPDMAEVFYRRQLDFTRAAPRAPDQAPDLIVWPETAIPWRLDTAQPVLAEISSVAAGQTVTLGALRFDGDRLRNALAVLGPGGTVRDVYDKHHLVPFGEYIPFAHLADRLGLTGLAANGAGFASGPGPVVLDFGPLGRGLPLICYEVVFAHGVNGAPERPDFLMQVTNDAWFGQYAGPQQHLAQARMRAIEQGLPLMRAANTGISAMIDPFGRVMAALPLGVADFLDAPLPRPMPPTLYSKTGDAPVAILVLLGLVAGAVLRLRKVPRS